MAFKLNLKNFMTANKLLRTSSSTASSPSKRKIPEENINIVRKKEKVDKIVADFYQWPVLLPILPPILSIYYGGKIEEWTEVFTLLVVAGYLYGMIKLPWELYVTTSHSRRCGKTSVEKNNSDYFRLWCLEWVFFFLVFLSPLTGVYFLYYVKDHVVVYSNILDNFPIALYVLTAYIRPLIHLSQILKSQASSFHHEVHFPKQDVEVLKTKIALMENQISVLLVFNVF